MSDDDSWVTGASQLLVAFTIEVDNEFEHRTPHRTALSRAAGVAAKGPWLGSMAMWSTFLKFVPAEGITVAELRRAARTERVQLDGMRRWGYVSAETADGHPIDSPKMRNDAVLRPTRAGAAAAAAWAGVIDEVEGRWMLRFGAERIESLRAALTLSPPAEAEKRPEYLPVVGYGFWAADRRKAPELFAAGGQTSVAPGLSALLSRALLEFTLLHEQESPVSLAISENLFHIVDGSPIAVRDVVARSGIAEVSVLNMVAFLRREGLAKEVGNAGGTRSREVSLTARGLNTKDEAIMTTRGSHREFARRFGVSATSTLSAAIQAVQRHSSLADGLRPYPDGWRAMKPFVAHTNDLLSDPRAALPRFPVVTHRGGYPDGA